MRGTLAAALALGLSANGVFAQQPAYAQCGGVTYSGGTTCVSGYTCVYYNDYYWQCIPSSQATGMTTKSTTKAATTTLMTTTKSTTTSVKTTPKATTTRVTTTKSTTTTTKSTTTSTKSSTPTGGIKYWFSFGDSYTQTGFDPTQQQPSYSNPMGNPPYPGWTSSNGVNWLDVATEKYNSSEIFCYNLAYGGATIDANLIAPYTSGVLSLTDQTNQFLQYYASAPASAPWSPSNTLFSVFIGINDISNAWWRSDWSTFVDTLITAQFALIQKMYNAGGRKFLIFNIPPIDRAPANLGDSASDLATFHTALALWSTKLQTYIANFKSANGGTTFWFYDCNADFSYVLNNPSQFGMNPDLTLYGTDPTYAWNNNFHPGIIIQDYLGKRVAAQLGNW
ncbi:hypothetical protein AA313_de0200486 [Arthrobotrys entomopaga]|nr:hypothetical protein AA313_de0200486 [Arthrobotrys entomopaga]